MPAPKTAHRKPIQSKTIQLKAIQPKTIHPKTAARRAALKILVALESGDIIFPQALNTHLPTCPPETRPLVRELASGVLRHRARLDWTLAPLLKKPLPKLDAPVRAALRLAAYERIMLKTHAPVVGNEYSGLMKTERLLSAVAFVNAVTRRLPETPRDSPSEKDAVAHLATEYSHPVWLVERWLARFGFEECAALLAANNCIAPLSLRVNTLRTSREEILESLQARELKAKAGVLAPDCILVESAGDPTNWPEWKDGKIIAQDEAAQLVSIFANPQPGQIIIDGASAPGGKSTHMAQLMNNAGKILACDVGEGRLKLVRENASRLGIKIVETRAGDLREMASNLQTERQAELPPADLVLLDAPCLGTGTLRRRPDSKWNKTPQQLKQLVGLQRELLESAASLVCSGGVLVYSTCSLEPEENENQIALWLERHADWQVEMRSTLPHRDNCDGMFAARLTKPKA